MSTLELVGVEPVAVSGLSGFSVVLSIYSAPFVYCYPYTYIDLMRTGFEWYTCHASSSSSSSSRSTLTPS